MIQRFAKMCGYHRGPIISAFLHLGATALLLLAVTRASHVQVVTMPGSLSGKHLLLAYTTGGLQSEAKSAVNKQVVSLSKTEATRKFASVPSAAKPAPAVEQGSGSAGLSGLGSGDVTIALVINHPRPEPDLSSLPHGHSGNVILNAVIDTHGLITELTVLQGLSDSIDQQVMATVRDWSFKPATKNGQPVTSEQEIIFHYEHG